MINLEARKHQKLWKGKNQFKHKFARTHETAKGEIFKLTRRIKTETSIQPSFRSQALSLRGCPLGGLEIG